MLRATITDMARAIERNDFARFLEARSRFQLLDGARLDCPQSTAEEAVFILERSSKPPARSALNSFTHELLVGGSRSAIQLTAEGSFQRRGIAEAAEAIGDKEKALKLVGELEEAAKHPSYAPTVEALKASAALVRGNVGSGLVRLRAAWVIYESDCALCGSEPLPLPEFGEWAVEKLIAILCAADWTAPEEAQE